MKGDLLIVNIGQLATALGSGPLRGPGMKRLHLITHAAILVEDGIIAYAGVQEGPDYEAALKKARAGGYPLLDAGGKACVPGFVDSHTHFLFAGFRADEFFWRAEGLPYMEIHRRGGGIGKTTRATREASFEELLGIGGLRLKTMLAQGITTVEGKSGYGLDRITELRQLEAMAALDAMQPVDIVRSFMGAHSIPPEYAGRTKEYIDFIIAQVLPEVARKKLAEFADIFCEKGVFELEDSRRYLEAAKALGLGLKIHADEIEALGGAGLAAAVGALSAEHLLKASSRDLAAMAAAGVIAVCLPLTAFVLKEPYADARGMIDAGLALALASDLNPGSCYSQSIALIASIAVLYMGLSFAETLCALTLNGAAALGRADRIGSIEQGKHGDIVILDAPEASHLAYNSGMNLVVNTIKSGALVYSR
ncbi:MAG: imidazolonepropionase [Spirochaetia bacterium]|jgi:imidazolonepropionase|nr:imidazolonepropionase [Spirochaetia bacterium]